MFHKCERQVAALGGLRISTCAQASVGIVLTRVGLNRVSEPHVQAEGPAALLQWKPKMQSRTGRALREAEAHTCSVLLSRRV